ncbi:hypothetical protein B7R21_16755 [Subtercola boreus]|uniref:Uncharacterized protein n=1 Tax=Subtercola boreus TaxID=120213 RepID=A0A3E0VCJ0_9MICO|nr:FAD-dependent oxidoreductase [Subtercola boreus]RFA07110.1 hypothetical protein B7R21_16755 [Subtercola boreus]
MSCGDQRYRDTVGVGHYYWIDRHATTGGSAGGGGLPEPFEIPLGSLIPQRVRNLLPAAKNIGTTRISNSSYRLQPVEWSIGGLSELSLCSASTGACSRLTSDRMTGS